MSEREQTRRTVLGLAALSGLGTTGLAGCLGIGDDGGGTDTTGPKSTHSHGGDGHSHSHGAQSIDPPKAVYKPLHTDEMKMIGKPSTGGVTFGTMHSAPHPFLNVQSGNKKRVKVDGSETMHLMVKPWSTDPSVVPATASLSAEITKDGQFLGSPTMWPMLSQPMGFHFGENVTLDGPGTYTVEIRLVPPSSKLTGSVADTFGEPIETQLEFEVGERDLQYGQNAVPSSGQKGATKPMMGKKGQLTPAEDLPGTFLGTQQRDDAVFAMTKLTDVARLDASDSTYLAVSPRTPYNRYPLSNMSLSATVMRDSETIFDGSLTDTLDEQLGLHYGTTLDSLQTGDRLTVRVDGGRSNVSRHAGYDTAFLEMDTVELTVGEL
jgi:hypothetical protein